MKQAHIFVSGYVQGVWYRKFVKTNAIKLDLTGWVCNIPQNRVEIVAQGQEEIVEKLIELCHKGPPFAEVKDVKVTWEPVQEIFKDFSIR